MSFQQQHQECSEIHTIQIFREADMIVERLAPTTDPTICSTIDVRSPVTSAVGIVSESSKPELAPIPYFDAEVYESENKEDAGIGGDWAIEDDGMDAIIETPPSVAEQSGSDSTLYSFYFETPVVAMAAQQQLQEVAGHQHHDDDDDDFTITSQDSESFHNTTDLHLDNLEDSTSFWETGLAAPTLEADQQLQHPGWCTSPAHVSLTGDELTVHMCL